MKKNELSIGTAILVLSLLAGAIMLGVGTANHVKELLWIGYAIIGWGFTYFLSCLLRIHYLGQLLAVLFTAHAAMFVTTNKDQYSILYLVMMLIIYVLLLFAPVKRDSDGN